MTTSLNLDSPRTIEAMQRLGIQHSMIRQIPLSSFAEDGLLMEFQKGRHEHHEVRRRRLLEEIATERGRVAIDRAKQINKKVHGESGAIRPIDETSKSNDLIARELGRLRKLEERQKKEFSQFLEHEIKVQEIAKANEEKMVKERANEDARLKAKHERAAAWEHLRKQREEQRYNEELEELKRQEVLAERQFEEAQRIKEKELQEERRRRLIAQHKELERRHKAEEREAKLEQAQAESLEAAAKRQADIDAREAARMDILERKREHEAEGHRQQAEAMRIRLESVKEKERLTVLKKLDDFAKKSAQVARRRAKFEEKRAQEIQFKYDESVAHMKRIRAALEANNQKNQRRKEEFQMKEILSQQRAEALAAERFRETQRRKEMDRQQHEDRVETIHRLQLAYEYKRNKILEQTDLADQVTKRIKMKTEKLVKERRKIAQGAQRQKHELSAKVEWIKSCGQFNPETLMREFGLKMPENAPVRTKHTDSGLRKATISRSVEHLPILGSAVPNEESAPVSAHRLAKVASAPGFFLEPMKWPKITHMTSRAARSLRQCASAYHIDTLGFNQSGRRRHRRHFASRKQLSTAWEDHKDQYNQQLVNLLQEETILENTRSQIFSA